MKKNILWLALILASPSTHAMELCFTLSEQASKMFNHICIQTGITDPFSIHVKLDFQKQETVEELLERMSVTPSLTTKGEVMQIPCNIEYNHEKFPLNGNTLIIDSSKVSMTHVTISFNPAEGLEELPLPATGMFMLNDSKRHIKIDYCDSQGFFYN